ncbi:lysylphosphatidylglycerol synthase transmembrane domain-containing protein [Moritella sp. Urea-trap-13]|uniref:lysylphosphatidylglycerol synthase transmembrane domain-containing protein n=1 Tax=Moritella sp. Urea-trap-13 TaxID=2058327 RepID=UPI000C33390C|nr:lysylphosphatidylglycerol synthase transmembrane domain-containing protein [Moritella sp. Urea-trap-13]PKH05239.1 hypothetical protein CXF93_18270 [Moritella sp. Urea-trap-13]
MQALKLNTYLNRFKSIYLLLTLGFVLFIAWRQLPDFRNVVRHLDSISIEIFASSLVLAACSYSFRSLRWLLFIRLTEQLASCRHHIFIYLSGFAFTASPAKAGELMRGTHLMLIGVPFRYTLCSFISERLFDVISVLLLGSYFLIYHFNIAFSLLLILILILPFMVSMILNLVSRWLNNERLLNLILVFRSLWKKRIVATSMLYSLCAWSAQGFILYLILIQLGVEISIPMAVSIYCLSLLIGAASLIPSGIGATELGMIWLLNKVGVENDIAFISSLVTRMVTLWPAMLLGLLCAFSLNKAHESEV